MKPERFGIELAPGGNILPVMNAWKQFAGTEGGIYYYYDFPKNAMNDWLEGRVPEDASTRRRTSSSRAASLRPRRWSQRCRRPAPPTPRS